MKITLLSTLAVAAAFPAMVAAQAFDGTAMVGYAYNDAEGSQGVHTPNIEGRFGYDAGNGFRFGADLSGMHGSENGVSGDLSLLTGGLYGSYKFANGFNLGMYGENASIDVSGLADDLSARSIGLMGGYDIETTKVSAFMGRSKTSPSLPEGVDIKDYGIAARFNASEQFTFGGSIVRSTVSGYGVSADLDYAGIAGAYRIDPSWTVFGGLTDTKLESSGSITSFGLGASYDMSNYMREGSSMSLEVARSKLTGVGHMNTLRVGLSVPIGGTASSVPLNSVADAAMNPRHNALTSAILSAF
jgi:hypothetical protein